MLLSGSRIGVVEGKKMSDEVLKEINARLGDLQSGLHGVERRLASLEIHVQAMDTRLIHDLKEINAGFRRMRAQDELLDARIDEMQARIERLEGRMQ
jgi:predicted  nucleic acid-binding Zn-ribbon protein